LRLAAPAPPLGLAMQRGQQSTNAKVAAKMPHKRTQAPTVGDLDS
jgi:hypothetical protein